METEDIHQTEIFHTDPVDLYKCIMDARIHSSFTGEEAIIEDKEGANFSVFDGYAHGKNIVLERGRKIVQTWRAEEDNWPQNYFSEVAFIFNEIPEGTRLDFYHSGIPKANIEKISKGWKEYYWEPLKTYLDR